VTSTLQLLHALAQGLQFGAQLLYTSSRNIGWRARARFSV
jgi:hypothetical protein